MTPHRWIHTTTAIVVAALSAGVLIAQQAPQRPVFRGGANFVLVDAYPMQNDRIVEGLTVSDFQILEDGKPQKIEALEFVRVDTGPFIGERRDPNNQREMLAAARDPYNRVFVAVLDLAHVRLDGSHRLRRPLVDALNRLLAENDLYGVTTTYSRARDLVLARRLEGLEEQLSKYWIWGEQGGPGGVRPLDPREMMLSACFHIKWKALRDQLGRVVQAQPVDWMVNDGAVRRFFDEVLIERLREDVALSNLEELVDYLGQLREARKVLMPMTDGWILFEPNRAWEAEPSDDARTGGGVSSAKSLLDPQLRDERMQTVDWGKCLTEMNRLVSLQHGRRLRDLIERANRNNVSFYPLRPDGLSTGDGTVDASRRVIPNPKAGPGESILMRDLDRLNDRINGLRTVAENTDGLAVVNNNDLAAGFRRIIDDVSAYYLIGYSSTNPAQDGKYRRIEVKTTAPNVRMRARRGYVAASAAAATTPNASAPGTVPVTEALATLTRFRPDAEVFLAASASASEVLAIVELNAMSVLRGTWAKGASIAVDVTDAKGSAAGTGTGKIDLPASAALVRVAVSGPAPWRVRARIAGATDGPVEERVDVPADAGTIIGPTVMYRALPAPASPVIPAANQQYRRTERVHLQWSVTGALERREGRLLGKNGLPLPVPVRFSDREVDGRPGLAADINLAPLSAGEYVIEITVGRGDMTEKKLIAIRVLQ